MMKLKGNLVHMNVCKRVGLHRWLSILMANTLPIRLETYKYLRRNKIFLTLNSKANFSLIM